VQVIMQVFKVSWMKITIQILKLITTLTSKINVHRVVLNLQLIAIEEMIHTEDQFRVLFK